MNELSEMMKVSYENGYKDGCKAMIKSIISAFKEKGIEQISFTELVLVCARIDFQNTIGDEK